MNTMTEDILVQQTTANYLLNSLQWDDSVYAMDETLGKEGTLGRDSESDLVLTRYLGEALMRLNPDLPTRRGGQVPPVGTGYYCAPPTHQRRFQGSRW